MSGAQSRGKNVVASKASQAIEQRQPSAIDLRSLRSPILTTKGVGTGVVIAGGGIYLKSAWVTVRMVRHFGWLLPIELWMLPWETITDDERKAMESFGVIIRTADAGYCLDEKIGAWGKSIWLAGWQLKVQAVLQSKFRRVVFLDADCYPVESGWIERLKSPGATFLGDVAESDVLLSPEAINLFGVTHTPVDSGCFMVDKSDLRWCEILGALNGPEWVRDTYCYLFGDKDSWWISHQLAGSKYRILPRGKALPGMVGIRHQIGVLHRTGCKFMTAPAPNTPQQPHQWLEGDELTSQFLEEWPSPERSVAADTAGGGDGQPSTAVVSQDPAASTAMVGLEECHGIRVRNSKDVELVNGVLGLDEYRLNSLGEQRWIVDAGGHVGSFSVACARRWPSARIIAFEPDQDNCRLFRLNASSAELISAALGEDIGTVSLVDGGMCPKTVTGEDCQRVKLSDQLRSRGWPQVDLLKVDIEGDEAAVFRDLVSSGLIRRVGRIVGEWHTMPVLAESMELLRATHHLTVCCHHWEHGYFEATRNDQ